MPTSGRTQRTIAYARNVRNPYLVGQRAVLNYMGVVELCAMAAKLRATGSL